MTLGLLRKSRLCKGKATSNRGNRILLFSFLLLMNDASNRFEWGSFCETLAMAFLLSLFSWEVFTFFPHPSLGTYITTTALGGHLGRGGFFFGGAAVRSCTWNMKHSFLIL
jgi:hypothetical protein